MKICIITPNFPPENGAASSRIFFMASAMKDAGLEVEVLSVMPSYPTDRIAKGYRGKWYVKEEIAGICVRRVWMYPSHSVKTFPRLLSMGTQAIGIGLLGLWSFLKNGRPERLFVQSPPLPLAFSGYGLARMFGIRLVANFSDIWPRAIADLGHLSEGFLYKALHGIEKKIYKNAELCVGQSDEIVSYIQKYAQKPVFLYRTGVDTRLFFPADPVPKRGETLKMVYAGLLGVAQGMLEVCKNVDFAAIGAELHILGAGSEETALRLFLELNPGRGVYFSGWVPAKEVADKIRGYDVALVPQKAKVLGTFPSKIYEAMASGLPVLLMSRGEAAEIVTESQAGLVSPPGAYEELKKNILLFKTMPDESIETMRLNARKTAIERFDRKGHTDDLILKITGG